MPQFRYDLHDISARNAAEIKGDLLTRLIQLALRNIYSDEPRERLRELLNLIDTVIDQPTALDILESLLRYDVQGTRRLDEQDVRTLLIEHRPGEPLMQTFIEKCSEVLGRVKTHVEERVRTQLRRRHKLRSRAQGYARFPNAHLYDHVGLFKVPTTAGWTSAHASA